MLPIWLQHPDTKLVFVGKGDLESELKAMAVGHGYRDKVLFLGWRDDVHAIMHLLDIFVLPSLNEGMGRVIVEAMAAGLPVVASNTGGIPDLVVEGETGLLAEPGNTVELAAAIQKLLDKPELRRQLGQAGQKYRHRFSEEAMIEKLDRLYQSFLGAS